MIKILIGGGVETNSLDGENIALWNNPYEKYVVQPKPSLTKSNSNSTPTRMNRLKSGLANRTTRPRKFAGTGCWGEIPTQKKANWKPCIEKKWYLRCCSLIRKVTSSLNGKHTSPSSFLHSLHNFLGWICVDLFVDAPNCSIPWLDLDSIFLVDVYSCFKYKSR